MGRLAHRTYIIILSSIVVFTTLLLTVKGIPYYQTSLEERFFHPDHDLFKPSGLFGHGLGIIGSLLILIGVSSYMARKRFKVLSRLGQIKHWLEFHIFLCTLGPIMVLFHTAFKFGGLVAVSFWSMVAVVASGVIGRFIYLQIPRSIEGRELSLHEVKELQEDISMRISEATGFDNDYQLALSSQGQEMVEEQNLIFRTITKFNQRRTTLRGIRKQLRNSSVVKSERKHIISLVKSEMSLHHRIERLLTMQKIFRYWHVAHLPFAISMLVIMLIHVAVTVTFGNTWIF
ncbi:MAG: hypothetical protein OEQ53_19895 [Saprospiraceae bacterium]|nr:hypothetical protein [Saprospiraceae bacterium]